MNGTRKNKGFTLAEILIVVAIVVILAGVVFIAVERHQRSTTLLEMDGIAKEIFVAAQNHLSLADSQGLVAQRSVKGAQDPDVTAYYKARAIAGGMSADDAERLDVRYFIVPGDSVTDETSVLSLMLPQAAVDEAVRLGGSFVVFYDCNSATVLDVFYSEKSGGRFAYDFSDGYGEGGVDELLELYAGADKKNDRKTGFSGGSSIIGWYGGAGARPTADPGKTLNIRSFEIVNGDRLYAVVPNPNPENEKKSFAELRLHVHGVTSGKDQIIDLVKVDPVKPYPNGAPDASGNFIVVLDDITTSGQHFAELFPDFVPGEDIELTLEAYSSVEVVTMPTPIGPKSVNSLFASLEGGTAEVASFRHLENLDADVSGFDPASSGAVTGKVYATGAVQTTDLVWSAFVSATPGDTVLGANPADLNDPKHSKDLGGGAGNYYPVDMPEAFSYGGQNHKIEGVTISYAGDYAGLFGTIVGGTVEDLELLNFSVNATKDTGSGGSAGVLAGRITSAASGHATVENVLAHVRQGTDYASRAVSATNHAGGLVGFVNGEGNVLTNCAAAVGVSSSGGDAGGLIGNIGGTSVAVSGCYSGGRTVNGKYTSYNITAAGSAGGLVGDAGSSLTDQLPQFTGCYSTCSAQGASAGGFAGRANAALTSCYATGLVSGSSNEGALVGVYLGATANVDDCQYYEIVNERISGTGLGANVSYLPYFGSGVSADVTALDDSENTYNAFLGAPGTWTAAEPYDGALMSYYLANARSNFPLASVSDLGASVSGDFVAKHYGDWPAPELWVKNQTS